ncbi:MAG: TraR/DksA C4-type zinc finger protein [Elusimicrobiota bacterium]
MNDDERKKFKKKVLAEIKDLKSRLPALKEAAKPVAPDNAVGRISRMDAINEQGVRESALREAKEKLRKLENRLERAADADFGLCSGCRQPIPAARLLYLPESDRCVACAPF